MVVDELGRVFLALRSRTYFTDGIMCRPKSTTTGQGLFPLSSCCDRSNGPLAQPLMMGLGERLVVVSTV